MDLHLEAQPNPFFMLVYLLCSCEHELPAFTMLQVSPNGYFLFGRNAFYVKPVLFPDTSTYDYMIAAFWTVNDIAFSGSVSYEVHSSETSSSLLRKVNFHINQKLDNDFEGSWMMITHWNQVPQYESSKNLV